MADQRQTQEFLGGGPKFNSVGRDNRSEAGTEEPVVRSRRTGDWLRVMAIILILCVLAAVLFYLNDRNFGKVDEAPIRGGQTVTPTDKEAPSADPNFK